MTDPENNGPLSGLRVLDLSRIVAGPWAAQTLGDLGADVIKIEQPGVGDPLRLWGPPFLDDTSGDSAYFASANRNKRSLIVDLARPEGAELIRKLVGASDILIENFKVGALARYGLDYDTLKRDHPRLIYCSVTGFGQTGPYRGRGGYDFLIQGMSGLMSVTGWPDDAAGGGPTKVGIPVSDLFAGLYATISILAALVHRDASGKGQSVDCALLDTQIAVLINQASNYLNGGYLPRRMGNEHPNVLPYQDFECCDGAVLVALGSDRQFRTFCDLLGNGALGTDPRFATNAARQSHRRELQGLLGAMMAKWRADDLIAAMEASGLPGGRVNEIPEILADPHVEARNIVQTLKRSDGSDVRVVAFPTKLSETPASCRRAPPRAGENGRDVLTSVLGMDEAAITHLVRAGIVQDGGMDATEERP